MRIMLASLVILAAMPFARADDFSDRIAALESLTAAKPKPPVVKTCDCGCGRVGCFCDGDCQTPYVWVPDTREGGFWLKKGTKYLGWIEADGAHWKWTPYKPNPFKPAPKCPVAYPPMPKAAPPMYAPVMLPQAGCAGGQCGR